MIHPDTFVGSVAIGVGLWAMWSALANWQWSFQLHKTRWLESMVGRTGARFFYIVLGVGMIALGFAIVCGFAPNKSTSQRERSRRGAGSSLLAIGDV